jgi:tetratricopeptide (TPR) repeat protein/transcriptional regulator with XRE-family HTH domain
MVEFSELFGRFVNRSGYTPGQLARLSGVPKMTIVNWLEGRVQKPRGQESLLKLAAVLHLNEAEGTELLVTAGYPTVGELRWRAKQENDKALGALLGVWPETAEAERLSKSVAEAERGRFTQSPYKEAPFQAIADLPYFTGREAEVAAIEAELLSGRYAAIYSLHGMGGVGKTALAAHLAYRLRPHFPDGVLWARVDVADTLSILATFAAAYDLDVSHYRDVDSRGRVVRDVLARKRALIVLDNVEQSQSVTPLLPPTGTCAVLITSRRRDLAVARGAKRFRIGPFDGDKGESLALFGRLLGQERVTAEQAALAEIASLLGHLPLAVDIAAGRLAYEPGWTAADFLARIRQANRRLTELEDADQSVRLSFQTSYEALPGEQQAFFAGLGVFGGEDFSVEATAAVAGIDEEAAGDRLRRLYTLSLVRQGRPGRFRLHPLLADYAREQLEGTAVYERMVGYYVEFVRAQPRHFQALATEHSNILAALETAYRHGMTAELEQGINGYYPFLEGRGLYGLAQVHLERVMEIGDWGLEIGESPGSNLQSPTLYHLGRLAERRGDYGAAEALFEQGLEQVRPVGDEEIRSPLLRGLGVLAAQRGDYALAEAYYREGLALARRLAHGGVVSDFIRGLGVQAYMRGDYIEAESLYEAGLALAESEKAAKEKSQIPSANSQVEGAEQEDILLLGLGLLAKDQDDLAQAERYFAQGLERARQIGHREREVMLLRELGVLAGSQEQYGTAERLLGEALTVARLIEHRWSIYGLLNLLGEIRLEQGHWPAAAAMFEEVAGLAKAAENQEMAATADYGLARVAVGEGKTAEARRLGHKSLQLFNQMGHFRAAEVKEWLTRNKGTQGN